MTFDNRAVTSLDWGSYRVLRFAEHPEVVPIVVQQLHKPSTGAGEEVMGATAAAIANAFFDTTGVRMRQFPMMPTRVQDAVASPSEAKKICPPARGFRGAAKPARSNPRAPRKPACLGQRGT